MPNESNVCDIIRTVGNKSISIRDVLIARNEAKEAGVAEGISKYFRALKEMKVYAYS